jgi:predicted amidohydrolase
MTIIEKAKNVLAYHNVSAIGLLAHEIINKAGDIEPWSVASTDR